MKRTSPNDLRISPRAPDLQAGNVVIRPRRFEIVRHGQAMRVEPKAMGVLLHLVDLRGEVATRDEIVNAVWEGVFVSEDVLTRAVSLLRKALRDDPSNPVYIETIRGGGYRWKLETSPLDTALEKSATEQQDLYGATPSEDRAPPARQTHIERHHAGLVAQAGTGSRQMGFWGLALLLVVSVVLEGDATNRVPAFVTPVVAVLPLDGSEGSPGLFGSTLAMELASELVVANGANLQVIGYQSVNRALAELDEGASWHPEKVGRFLAATHVVEVSVRRAPADSHGVKLNRQEAALDPNEQVFFDVHLLRVEDRRTLMRDSRRARWSDALSLQPSLAQKVVESLVIPKQGLTLERATHALPTDLVETYLKARFLLSRGSPSHAEQAVNLLRQIVTEAPEFPGGAIWLAEALLDGTDSPQSRLDEARALARAGLDLDPEDPRAHLVRFRIAFFFDWDWKLGLHHLVATERLAPGHALVKVARASYEAVHGRMDNALRHVAEAKRLDPLSARVQGDVALFYFLAEDSAAVAEEAGLLLGLDPGNAWAQSLREAALRDLDRSGSPAESRSTSSTLADADAETLSKIRDWEAARPGATKATVLASLYASLGRRETALDHIEEAIRFRSPWVPFIPVDPDLKNLRDDVRLRSILETMDHPLSRH